MKDLVFELQVKNYEKVHKNLSELDSEAMTDELWFGRGIAALGMTSFDRDRTKEARMCIEKINSILNDDLFVELSISINDLSKKIHQGSMNAYNKDMMKDKPDNVNYGLQVISGELAKTSFLMTLTEAFENICHIFKAIHPFIKENESLIEIYRNSIRNLMRNGLKKTDTYKELGKKIEILYSVNSSAEKRTNYNVEKESSFLTGMFVFLIFLFISFIIVFVMIPEFFGSF